MAEIHCQSEQKLTNSVTFVWEIRSCSHLTRETYRSPVFHSGNGNTWQLNYNSTRQDRYPIVNGHRISIVLVECKNPPLRANFKSYLMGLKQPQNQDFCEFKIGCAQHLFHTEVNLEDDCLTVKCELQEIEFVHKQSTKMTPIDDIPVGRILFDQQTNSDVILVVQGRQFKSHKCVLSAKSPVFKVIFQTDTKEQQTNIEGIPDIEAEVFEQFLRFIYTGEVENLETMARDLLTAGDKYDVQPLRGVCIRHFLENLSVENAAEMLALTGRHSLDDLKSYVIVFIYGNIDNVRKTAGWYDLIESNPRLIIDVYEKSNNFASFRLRTE